MKKLEQSFVGMRMRPIAAAVATAVLAAGNAAAFEIDTGNEDVTVRWDNTVRYNAGWRMGDRNNVIGNSFKTDEGDYSFGKGGMVANRLDLLSELDVVYKKDLGFRISGTAWADGAYSGTSQSNPTLKDQLGRPAAPSYINNQYSNYTKRFYAGPSGEVLDAFVFGNFEAGNVPVRVKAGRHTVFWGESLFLGGALNGISYSQNPLDLQKGFATPGTEAKELFRPLNQISAQAQLSDTLSVAGQYFLQWESYRYPEGGTYLGPVDFAFNGPDRVVQATHPVLGPLGYTRRDPVNPKDRGEFGLAARWSPAALDGTVGFYYRRFADKVPQGLVTRITAAGGFPVASGSDYRLIYADNIDLFGISLAKNIGGASVGAELSYRRNTPLLAPILGNASAAGVPAQGETSGPRGDTMHGLINVLGGISKTPVFDAATVAAELTWSHYSKVRSNPNLFQAEGYAGCAATGKPASAGPANKWDGCATRNYVGLGLSFTPTWFQAFPGIDLSAPIAYSVGLKGNAATTFGGNQGNGNYSLGLGADVHQKYRIDLKYIGYFGHVNDYGTGNLISQNGFTSLLKDRDFISLTLKTTF